TGLPKTVILNSEEIREALEEPVSQIIDAIRSTLDKTPPELAADIMDRGIVLAGGGALLHGLDDRLRHRTPMPTQPTRSPLACMRVGSGSSLKVLEELKKTAKARSRQRNGYRNGYRGYLLKPPLADPSPPATCCNLEDRAPTSKRPARNN